MQQAITTMPVGTLVNYTDVLNNTRTVKQSVLLNDKEKAALEEAVVEELVRIFTHKVG
jgi:hypothetical protein